MATLTKNYSLTKPDGSDKAQISVLNTDFDQIDEQMKKNADAAASAQEAADGKQDPITVDTTATSGSNNPISSDAVYTINDTLTKADAAEAERAAAAEEANAKAITAETERATAAEEANSQAISDEAGRAATAEKENADAITAETKRATAAEEALTTSVNGAIQAYIGKSDGMLHYKYQLKEA